MNNISTLFPDFYETSRTRFKDNLSKVQNLWPNAKLSNHRLTRDEDLTIDWISTDALVENDKLLILTTGEHGIEGYVGSAMMQRFIEVYLPQLDAHNTGLLLVHAINPWGMKYKRRTNQNNVDLNRNFVWDSQSLDPNFNPEYGKLDHFLNSPSCFRSLLQSNLIFATRLSAYLLTIGHQSLRHTALQGQYRNPKGIHYGGNAVQEETGVLKRLYFQAFQDFNHIVQLDMHTGYGPRYQMSLVNSYLEPRKPHQLSQLFAFPSIVETTTADFYAIQGDMIDYIYTLFQEEFSHKRLYATSFEFGTFGLNALALIRSLRAMIFENQCYWHGASDDEIKSRIQLEFQELFNPQEGKWRAKAIADADQAFNGILKAEGFIPHFYPSQQS